MLFLSSVSSLGQKVVGSRCELLVCMVPWYAFGVPWCAFGLFILFYSLSLLKLIRSLELSDSVTGVEKCRDETILCLNANDSGNW